MTAGKPPLLAVTGLPALMLPLLEPHFEIHHQLHETDPQAFERLAPRIVAVAAGGESQVRAPLIERLPALRAITVMGVGYDGVDVAAAKARGVLVTHTPNVLNDAVADLAIGLLIAAARQIPAADRFVRAGQWLRGPMPLQRQVTGARLGLVGMGRIGKQIALRALAFRMSVAYTARSAKPELPYTFHATPKALAAAVDFLVVITPGGAATRKLVDAEVLAALGKGRGEGIVVNASRGTVIDETALIAALQGGVIAGAALDVFEDEPRVPQALIDLPQVLLTPHMGSATTETRQAMAELALENLMLHLAGQPAKTPVPECR